MDEQSGSSCAACRGELPALRGGDLTPYVTDLGGDWRVVDEHHLERTYQFPNFVGALAFVNRVGDVAEAMGHHPDVYLSWGSVRLTIWTYRCDGLTETDFRLAREADRMNRGGDAVAST
jgi:4a-hydroxytetrahydrobiopterin dehydratase